jgi:rhodanese-related sulfurtransferase
MTIHNIIDHLKDNLTSTDITLYPAASDSLISYFEQSLSVRLPDDVKQFYQFANGFESAEDQFRILPLDEMTEQTNSNIPNTIPFAEYMVYCDIWHLEINPQDHNVYTICNVGRHNEKVVLSHSFAGFLHRFIKGGVFKSAGLYDWYDKV